MRTVEKSEELIHLQPLCSIQRQISGHREAFCLSSSDQVFPLDVTKFRDSYAWNYIELVTQKWNLSWNRIRTTILRPNLVWVGPRYTLILVCQFYMVEATNWYNISFKNPSCKSNLWLICGKKLFMTYLSLSPTLTYIYSINISNRSTVYPRKITHHLPFRTFLSVFW